MISFHTEITSKIPSSACVIKAVFDEDQHLPYVLAQGDTLIHTGVLWVGCGARQGFTGQIYQQALRAAAIALTKARIPDAVWYLPTLPLADNHDYYWKIRQAVTAVHEAVYQFTACKSQSLPTPVALQNLIFHADSAEDRTQGQQAIIHSQAIAEGIKWTKDLGNLPANICTPMYVAQQAQSFAKQYPDQITTTVLEEAEMEKLGMGALLSVARGSREPAKLITVHYRGASNESKPVVLVGKGITFDSGGISLKPGLAMDEMKFDMCGAGAVLGTLKTAVLLALPINIIGIMPMTENMPGGSATKPGDIVTSLSGQTIEILNTDAEGRLILCDALTYSERFNPDTVIDIATLTGAIVATLGSAASGLMGNDQTLVNELINAGNDTGDRVWSLPIWDEYQELLKSNFADIPNISEGSAAKSITAACFLSRFTKNLRWAHLDIAGTAWKTGKEKGATGRPVPLLVQYLLNRCGFSS